MSLGKKSLILVLFLLAAFAGTWTPVWPQAPPPKYAYVANFNDNTVSGYLRDATTGALTAVPGSPFATGNGPAAVTVDVTGSCVFVVNFISNNISAYRITPTTGALTQVGGSPFAAGTGPLGISVDVFSELVYVANALSNDVSAYKTLMTTCALTPVSGSPFSDPGVSAPASVVVEQTASFVYVANEFSNNVSGFAITIAGNFGGLTRISGSPWLAGSWPISVVAVPLSTVHFIYVSNDGSNNVSGYSYSLSTGALTPVPGTNPIPAGACPGLATIAPGGRQLYVPNFSDNTISGFNIATTCIPGPCDGAMTPVTGSPFRAGSGPTSVAVEPLGHFAYVTNALANDIFEYDINGTNGALTVSGAPFSAGGFAIFVFFTP